MDKNTLLLIFVLFLVSSYLWNISWNIALSFIYLIIVLSVLNVINPESAFSLRSILTRIINLDSSLLFEVLSTLSKFIIGFFNSDFYKRVKTGIPVSTDDYLYSPTSRLGNKEITDKVYAPANQEDGKNISLTPTNVYNKPQTKTTSQAKTIIQPKSEAKTIIQPKSEAKTIIQPKLEAKTIIQPKSEIKTIIQPKSEVKTIILPKQSIIQPNSEVKTLLSTQTKTNTPVVSKIQQDTSAKVSSVSSIANTKTPTTQTSTKT